jgi:hypothetical protein
MIQVGIADNLMAGGISIAMRIKAEGPGADMISYAQPSDTGFPRWEVLSIREAAAGEQPPGPLLTLDDDMAMALLDALQRHYQGNSDTRALRADYDAERKRVDKMMDRLLELAARPQDLHVHKAEQ